MFTISALTYGTLHFAEHDPQMAVIRPDYYIPGSNAFESANTFGRFFFQQVEQKHFTIWKSLYAPQEDVTLRVRESSSWLGFRLLLKKHIRHMVSGQVISMMQGQVNFAYTPVIDSEFRLRNGELYEVFDMQVTPALLKKLKIKDKQFELFLERMGAGTPEWIILKPAWSNVVVLDAVDYLAKDPYKAGVAEEVVRQVIAALTRKRGAERNITEQQLENLYAVREEIKAQFAGKMHLQQWATKAQMNITYFKEMFKQVFELTPYHYLLYERLKAVKAMMTREPDLSLAEAARRCGFTSYNNLRRAFNTKENITLTQWRNLPRFLSAAFAWETALENMIS
ncbi:helix-turn-helix domain-containing protein [Agriterribacter sp.]|uniref:AraC family transcriptional regulator n=1 Tax=Agriterribacter sp. TaxID=2821509 RepID=UPI002C4504F2|nr:helix-turn-helix domain-containing protein [Agriterribacter sp.]HTN05992.1 helix-turn-helix domain-containing protein [Agriterribacter sp.]